MSNFDDIFDKNYANRMREQTDLDFSDQDWRALAGRLDEADRKKRRGTLFWSVAGLAGLLLLSNLLWFFTFDGIKNEVRAFETNVMRHRDTIYQTVIEHRVDTVFVKSVQELRSPATGFVPKTGFPEAWAGLQSINDATLLQEIERRRASGNPVFFEKSGPETTATTGSATAVFF